MGNPFNEERQEKLKEDSLEFLKNFGIQYGKAYGVAMFEFVKAQMEAEQGEEARKLLYRPKNQVVKRPQLFRGACYMKEGEGQGSFGKWKKVYVAERADYNIDIFKSEGDCQANKKPKCTIKVGGYQLTTDVTHHFKSEMRSLAGPLDLDDESFAFAFSPYSWALTHFNRTNYLFQLHKGKDPFCSCLGGSVVEPEEAGAEHKDEREVWVEWMKACVGKCCARDLDSTHGKAFDNCMKGMAIKCSNLRGFKDDGSEPEILVDMLMQQVLMPMRDDILKDIQVPGMMKLPVWYKTRAAIVTVLTKIVEPAWNKMAEQVKALGAKIEAPIKQGMAQVLKAKQAVKDKVQEVVADRISAILAKMLTPYLKPVFQVFEKPVKVGFDMSKAIYMKNVDYYVKKGLPSNTKERNSLLDQIPRHANITKDIKKNCNDLIKPITALAKLSDEIFGDLDPHELKNTTEEEILMTLDAAVYTFEVRLQEAGPQQAPAVYEQVLQDYNHDIQLARAGCVKKVMRVLIYDKLMQALEPTVGSAVDDLDSMIPEPMQDFITVRSNYEEFCEMMFAEPIDKMVQAAYPA